MKDRRNRIADVAAARFALDYAEQSELERAFSSGSVRLGAPSKPSDWRNIVRIAAALVVVAIVAGGTVWLVTRRGSPAVVRTSLDTSVAAALIPTFADRDIAITPDGARVIYRGGRDALTQLFIRSLDQSEPVALTGLGIPRGPFVAITRTGWGGAASR